MAQAIHCDGEGHRDAAADVLVSRLENGETSAWCFDHYVEVCAAIVATVEQARAEAAAADTEALARLEAVGAAQAGKAGDVDPEAEAEPGPGGEFPLDGVTGPAGDVADQAGLGGPETGDTAGVAPEATAELSAQPGPSTEPSEDAAGPTAHG